MLKVPEINQVVELEEMGGEEGRDEGDPDAEAFSGNQEAEVLEGNHETGEAGEEGGGEQEAGGSWRGTRGRGGWRETVWKKCQLCT